MENKQACAAFVQAQKNFGAALKTSSNPQFKTKYADLSACVEAVIDGLNNAGLALMQLNTPATGGVSVETIFIHESGESLSGGITFVPASKQDPQGYGSALTYARRYGLMSACGIAPEDDDGNQATASYNKKPVQQPQYSKQDEEKRLSILADLHVAMEEAETIEELKTLNEKAYKLCNDVEKTELLACVKILKEKLKGKE